MKKLFTTALLLAKLSTSAQIESLYHIKVKEKEGLVSYFPYYSGIFVNDKKDTIEVLPFLLDVTSDTCGVFLHSFGIQFINKKIETRRIIFVFSKKTINMVSCHDMLLNPENKMIVRSNQSFQINDFKDEIKNVIVNEEYFSPIEGYENFFTEMLNPFKHISIKWKM